MKKYKYITTEEIDNKYVEAYTCEYDEEVINAKRIANLTKRTNRNLLYTVALLSINNLMYHQMHEVAYDLLQYFNPRDFKIHSECTFHLNSDPIEYALPNPDNMTYTGRIHTI